MNNQIALTSAHSELSEALTGTVVLPGDPGWDAARSGFNLLDDQHPAAVAFPVDATDVAAAVKYAGRAGLRVAPQATGHNQGPLGDLDGTLLLNVSRLQEVRVDPGARQVRVGAGVKWDRVAPRLSAHGLAGLHGSSPDVGIAGYSLGGGMGWLARKHGLQTNAVTALELVTAEGAFVRADHEHHADLFWALRGGGGNFGVVTAIEFAVHPVDELYAGALFFPFERASEVLHTWSRAAGRPARRAHVVGVAAALPADPRRARVRARPLVRGGDGGVPRQRGRGPVAPAPAARPRPGAGHVRHRSPGRARRPGDGPVRPPAAPQRPRAARRPAGRRRSTRSSRPSVRARAAARR